MIKATRNRRPTSRLAAPHHGGWHWFLYPLLWAALLLFGTQSGGESYFVVGRGGEWLVPMGLFALEKKLLWWLLNGSFATWVAAVLLARWGLAEWAARVFLGIVLVFVPAVMVMSRPEYLLPWLPAGARAYSESQLQQRAEPPRRLFMGDPVLRPEVNALAPGARIEQAGEQM